MGESRESKLQKISGWARYLVIFLIAVVGLAAIGTVTLLGMLLADPGMEVEGLSHSYLVGTSVGTSVGFIFLLLALFNVYKLTASLKRSDSPFTSENVRYLMGAAFMFLGGWVVVIILRILLAAMLSSSVDLELSSLFFGIILYILSLIFEYGVKLQDESDGFV